MCGLRPAAHFYLVVVEIAFFFLFFFSQTITATLKPAAFLPSVLRPGIPRQPQPRPQDLPVGRVQPGDVSPRGSGHHRERRGQPGPEERPAEVHGDVPHGVLPTDQV